MNENINIAELLKDCPSGMELDCTMYEDVCFDFVDKLNIIHCYIQHELHKTSVPFNKHGTYNSNIKSKCVIFPKGKTTWEGFQRPFEDGDIVVTTLNNIAIIKEPIENGYSAYAVLFKDLLHTTTIEVSVDRLATEEEKAKLFYAIKANGYKWNSETKTFEKLIEPKFKVGDIITDEDGYKVRITEVNLEDECYGYESMIAKGIGGIGFSEQENWELVPNKLDIANLKPFDNCKYSIDKGRTWKFAQYWYIQDNYNVNDIEIELWQN